MWDGTLFFKKRKMQVGLGELSDAAQDLMCIHSWRSFRQNGNSSVPNKGDYKLRGKGKEREERTNDGRSLLLKIGTLLKAYLREAYSQFLFFSNTTSPTLLNL